MLCGPMATITVDLSTVPISYSPGPEVKHGDKVVFSMGSYPSAYTAVVTFPDGTCLTTVGPYTLGGGTLTTQQLTVSNLAPKKIYGFDAVIDDGTRERGTDPRGPEERDRKNGGIDVTSDPPEDPAPNK
ncbi:hypothetical protein HMI50_07480 [Corallococcus carmarthensis]|nr:hypothetical protein [Corallococcus carmarthensis]